MTDPVTKEKGRTASAINGGQPSGVSAADSVRLHNVKKKQPETGAHPDCWRFNPPCKYPVRRLRWN